MPNISHVRINNFDLILWKLAEIGARVADQMMQRIANGERTDGKYLYAIFYFILSIRRAS